MVASDLASKILEPLAPRSAKREPLGADAWKAVASSRQRNHCLMLHPPEPGAVNAIDSLGNRLSVILCSCS
ncbi:hypothetical protein ACLKA7_005652 [Drosophila subpalustris]